MTDTLEPPAPLHPYADTLTINPRRLAHRWKTAMAFTDPGLVRPSLSGVCVERFDTGWRLIATDSYTMVATWLPIKDVWPPAMYPVPRGHYGAIDYDLDRDRVMLVYDNPMLIPMLRAVKAQGKRPAPDVTLAWDSDQGISVTNEAGDVVWLRKAHNNVRPVDVHKVWPKGWPTLGTGDPLHLSPRFLARIAGLADPTVGGDLFAFLPASVPGPSGWAYTKSFTVGLIMPLRPEGPAAYTGFSS